MRLHSIKLSGFKSFADPTTVSFPSQMAGVVGPNGSGKSNIIDAVRWVLGERSARELRGGQLSDVIFNGSSTRQAANLAKIELKFENAYGKLRGDYARFNEISVAREIHPEGQSSFFLNNVRCRRRDVVDAFLGTGLGPRSYAIIQQGTISRLVDARPDELRQHLEEVAGISVYKERRNETSLRLKNTKENLSRLLDTIEELDKHLRQLQRQATNAQKYRKLKTTSDTLHNQLLVVRWRQLEARIGGIDTRYTISGVKSEALTAKQHTREAELAKITTRADELRDETDKRQRQYYELASAIQLVERDISNLAERRQTLDKDLVQAQAEQQQLQARQSSDQAEQRDLAERVARLEGDYATTSKELAERTKELAEVEQGFARLQSDYQRSQHQNYELQKQLELVRYQITQSEQHIGQLGGKADSLAKAKDDKHANTLLDKAMQAEQRGLAQHLAKLAELEKHIATRREQHHSASNSHKQSLNQLQQVERDLRLCEGRLESLQTLIDNKTRQGAVAAGYSREQLSRLGLKPWLGQLQVQPDWAAAVESALGELLRGYLAEDVSSLKAATGKLHDSGLSLGLAAQHKAAPAPGGLLNSAQVVQGPVPGWLQQVWFASSLAEALEHWSKLDGQRIVCKDGSQLARDWISLGHLAEGETLVSLQQRLKENQQLVTRLHQQHQQLESDVATLEAGATEARKQLDTSHETLRAAQQDSHASQSRLDKLTYQHNTASEAEQRRALAQQEVREQAEKTRQQLTSLHQQLTSLMSSQEALQQRDGDLRDRHNFTQQQVQNLRARVNEHNKLAQATQLELNNAQNRHSYIGQNMHNLADSLEQLHQRIARDVQQQARLALQPQQLRSQLDKQLKQLQGIQSGLDELRRQYQAHQQHMQEHNHQLAALREQHIGLREERQQDEIQRAELSTRQQGLTEQLIDTDFAAASQATPEDMSIGDNQQQLDSLRRSISTLGEVNHAAIKDLQTESERRAILNTQHQEIQQAIGTLEAAIAKIDKETKSLFQQTFDQLNDHLKRIFPDLLGGGSAWLELTSTNLLESGVQIIARPPGKKNTTVAMLSGGEKAMTAIALVLALFSQNPAPFCVLDEVDAPLDDNNVVRFVSTIQKISSRVQFVVVTHSKITMEYMDQLLGITMSEPGVSRIVSVDIQSALKMVV